MTFKFFRQYNKYILALGGSLLMIAFLIQPVIQYFHPDPSKQAVGGFGDQVVTQRDIRQARVQLEFLKQPYIVGVLAAYEPLQWVLMKAEAVKLGIWASDAHVDSLLTILGLNDPIVLRNLSVRSDLSEMGIKSTLRTWIQVQRYIELIHGLSHVPMSTRIQQYRMNSVYHRFGYYDKTVIQALGLPRASIPFAQHLTSDMHSKVRMTLISVPGKHYLPKIQQPDEQALLKQFETYQDDLPGQGEPYGMGYRYPDRVKLEYLELPYGLLLAHPRCRVSVDEALEAFSDNLEKYEWAVKDEDKQANSKLSLITRFKKVRSDVAQDLKRQKAAKLGQEMAAKIQKLAQVQENTLPGDVDGYHLVKDASWRGVPMDQIAGAIEKEYDFLPIVRRYDAAWINIDQLSDLRGIGKSVLADNPRASFSSYVGSAKAFEPDDENALVTYRLQQQMISSLLTEDDSYYLFRLLDVEKSHRPESIESVRRQVLGDANKIAAYQALLDDQFDWLARGQEEAAQSFLGLELELKVKSVASDLFVRRQGSLFGRPTVPQVGGIGKQEKVVDDVFALVSQLQTDFPGQAMPDIPADKRVGVTANDADQTLVIYRVDAYEPLAKSVYDKAIMSDDFASRLAIALVGKQSPIALDQLKQRLGYQPAHAKSTDDQTDQTPQDPTDAS